MDIELGSHVSIKSRNSFSSNASTTTLGNTDNPSSAGRFASYMARLGSSRKRTGSETASFSGTSILTASTLAPESSASLKSDKGKGKASEESCSSGAGTSSSSSFIFSPSSSISSGASVASSSTAAASSTSSQNKGKAKASDEASTENRESPRRKTLTIFTDAGTIQITPQNGGGGSIGVEGMGCGGGQSLVERYQELTKMLKGRGIFQKEEESEDEDGSLPRPEIPPEEFESTLLEYLQIRSILKPLLRAKERKKQAGASSTN